MDALEELRSSEDDSVGIEDLKDKFTSEYPHDSGEFEKVLETQKSEGNIFETSDDEVKAL
jgi:hypothetical protein